MAVRAFVLDGIQIGWLFGQVRLFRRFDEPKGDGPRLDGPDGRLTLHTDVTQAIGKSGHPHLDQG